MGEVHLGELGLLQIIPRQGVLLVGGPEDKGLQQQQERQMIPYPRPKMKSSLLPIDELQFLFRTSNAMDEDNDSMQEEQKRHVKQLMSKISFSDDPEGTSPKKYHYHPDSITPFCHFYKLLALRPCDRNHRMKLKLNVPDTIIFNDKDSPLMWIFTNSKGEVCRIDNLPYYTITSKLTEGALEKELVAVLKKAEYGYGGISGNDLKVVSAAEIKTVLSSILSHRSEVSVIQRFVKCHSVKASVLRTCWRRNGNNEGWVLSSNYAYSSTQKVNEISKFVVNTKMPKAFNAVKCTSQKYLKETIAQVRSIAKFVESALKISFTELVCDFVKDEGGNWWYVNTRAFILAEDKKVDVKLITMHDCDIVDENVQKKKLESYTRCRKCKYCYKVIAEHLMTHKLTLMMILQCDQHLIRLGKPFPWLDRCYSLHLDSVNLYVEHKICDSCYKFYKEVQKLVTLETKLAELTGIKIPQDNKNSISITNVPYFKGQSAQFGMRIEKMKYDTDMPTGWQLPREKQFKVELANDNLEVEKYRMMVYIHGVRDIPAAFVERGSKYYLQYDLLGQKVKVTLRIQQSEPIENNLFKVTVEKIKVFYLFAEKREKIKDYIKNHPVLEVRLFQNEDKIGSLELELEEFKSDKVIRRDFFKMFSGKKIFPYLSWGLFISVGISCSGNISTSALKLAKREGLLIPDIQYHNADPLPHDWMNMLEEKPDRKLQRNSTHEVSHSQMSGKLDNLSHLLSEQIDDYTNRKVPMTSESQKRRPHYL